MNWNTWLKSLGAAVIGGAATAGSSWLAMAGAQAMGANVPSLNLNSLGIILASGAITSGLAYLKQSPLPGAPAAPVGPLTPGERA
jgi:hypothetical protein